MVNRSLKILNFPTIIIFCFWHSTIDIISSIIQNHWKEMIFLPTHCERVNSSLTVITTPMSLTLLHLSTWLALYHLKSSQEGWVQYSRIFWERDRDHITFITVYGYNCCFITVVNILLCLLYKLNYHRYLCGGKHSIHGVQGYYSFRHPLGMQWVRSILPTHCG